MRKMIAVLKREYLQATRRKLFWIMTLLFPALMTGMMVVPGLMAARGISDKRVAVIDGTGKLQKVFTKENVSESERETREKAAKAMRGRAEADAPTRFQFEYVDASGKNVETTAKQEFPRLTTDDATKKLDCVFVIPHDAETSDKAEMKLYSASSADVFTEERLGRAANRAIQQMRLAAKGIDAATLEQVMREIPTDNIQLSRSGEQKKGGGATLIFAFVFGALLLLPSFIYGNDIMRGIVQEKSDRVVEVLVSSMTPLNLLTGKITGVAAVGLTQISVWLVMITGAGAYFGSMAMMQGFNISQFLRPSIYIFFALFFVLAYLTYVCIYAIAGAVSNSEKEAQQFIAPITIVMMMPWILMFPIATNPESPLAVGFSLAPVFGPFTMFIRTLVSEPPVTQILISIGVSIVSIAAFFWVTAKIFRVGILSYGKRPTIPELWRWLKVA
ncbi:MAG TPA: ABC transporter permease [Thermoanaerobaculia bacterium]|nr:ABC transporter permease [Thermoanaerobaculia bacterium]